MKMGNTIEIGFVGAGFNANFHVRSLVQVRDCTVAGVVGSKGSTSAAKLADLAKELRLGTPIVFESVEELAASPKVNAIWITSPNFTRVEVMQAIVRGNAKREKKLLGVACEKPLGRNVAEALELVKLAKEANLPTGYLENQVFAPTISRGKDIIWKRGAEKLGRPYLARAAEEHSGPHKPWFWRGSMQGGGVLNDMLCHSSEAARFLLTKPGDERDSLTVTKVSAVVASLKWRRESYLKELKEQTNVDYAKEPSEDYAHATITYKDKAGNTLISELTSSWSYVGAGLRLSFELLGPEYSLKADTLKSGVDVFFFHEE